MVQPRHEVKAENGGEGIRTPYKIPDKTPVLSQPSAKSGALCLPNGRINTDLEVIVDAWPSLPEPIRAGILAIVRGGQLVKYDC
jgi:hypothetical protein